MNFKSVTHFSSKIDINEGFDKTLKVFTIQVLWLVNQWKIIYKIIRIVNTNFLVLISGKGSGKNYS